MPPAYFFKITESEALVMPVTFGPGRHVNVLANGGRHNHDGEHSDDSHPELLEPDNRKIL
jgi:hypothetical protein